MSAASWADSDFGDVPDAFADPATAAAFEATMADRPDDGATPSADAGPDDAEAIDPAMVAAANALGYTGPAAWKLAARLVDLVREEALRSAARRIANDRDAERNADLGAIETGTALELLALKRPALVQSLGTLLGDGHNGLIVGAKKGGKSTLVENEVHAWTTGGTFLGRYPVPAPLRVLYCNYELTPEDFDQRVRLMNLPDDAAERLYVLNLRGHRLPLMAPTGRDWLVEKAAKHGADVIAVDPFGAAFAAAGGQSENDNAEVRRFVAALDEIKRLSGARTLVMPHHTGRGEQTEGEERGRGATVLEDWADVILYLTKDKSGVRYLRTEGRAVDLPESRLEYDPATSRLYLGTGDVGVNRRLARREEGNRLAAQIVRDDPGISKGDLTDAIAAGGITNNQDKAAVVAAAIQARLIHTHRGKGTKVHHYPGEPHLADEPCPAGHA